MSKEKRKNWYLNNIKNSENFFNQEVGLTSRIVLLRVHRGEKSGSLREEEVLCFRLYFTNGSVKLRWKNVTISIYRYRYINGTISI